MTLTDIQKRLKGCLPAGAIGDAIGFKYESIAEFGQKYKSSGYVVDSVPLAVFAAQKINGSDYKTILTELIKLGGDADTVCSMFGQIVGSLRGVNIVPDEWLQKSVELKIDDYISEIVKNWKE